MIQQEAEQLLKLSHEVITLIEQGAPLSEILVTMDARNIIVAHIQSNPATSGMNAQIYNELKKLLETENTLLIPYRAELQNVQEKLVKVKNAAVYLDHD